MFLSLKTQLAYEILLRAFFSVLLTWKLISREFRDHFWIGLGHHHNRPPLGFCALISTAW